MDHLLQLLEALVTYLSLLESLHVRNNRVHGSRGPFSWPWQTACQSSLRLFTLHWN